MIARNMKAANSTRCTVPCSRIALLGDNGDDRNDDSEDE